jgi:hypothetical protein
VIVVAMKAREGIRGSDDRNTTGGNRNSVIESPVVLSMVITAIHAASSNLSNPCSFWQHCMHRHDNNHNLWSP